MYEPYEGVCGRPDCNGRICLTAEQHQDTWENGTTFYCSQGHPRIWTKTTKRTYQQLEAQLRDLRDALDRATSGGWEHAESLGFEFATCPFDDCRHQRNGYRYRSQMTLFRHLDRFHGTRLVGAVIIGNANTEAS